MVEAIDDHRCRLFTGAHSNNPTGLIERLLPYVERGAVRIVAETTPAGYASLVARLPVIAGAFTVLRVEELDEHETVQLCTDVLESRTIAAAPSTRFARPDTTVITLSRV